MKGQVKDVTREIELDQLDEKDQMDAHEDLQGIRGLIDELNGKVTKMRATRGGPNSRMVNRLDVIQAEARACVPLLGEILDRCSRMRWPQSYAPKPAPSKIRKKKVA